MSSQYSYSLSYSTDQLIDWLTANRVDSEECDKIRSAKFQGDSFVMIKSQRELRELNIPLGTRLQLQKLAQQAKEEAKFAVPDRGPSTKEHIADFKENGCETCSALDEPDHLEVLPQAETAGGIFPHNKLWNITPLKVFFLNLIPLLWTYSGHKYCVPSGQIRHVIDTSDILRLANHWSTKLPPSIPKEKREKVPVFVQVSDPMDSDIRVWFTGSGRSWSKVGTNAESVPKGSKMDNATMRLNLNWGDRHKEHLVMHEFGHALGLGHEHQRDVFWRNIGQFFRANILQKKFGSDVAPYKNIQGPRSEYDPDSIMHYWFHCSWLQDQYNTEAKVEQHVVLTEIQKKSLKGLFQRNGKGLAEELSQIDCETIAATYYDHHVPN